MCPCLFCTCTQGETAHLHCRKLTQVSIKARGTQAGHQLGLCGPDTLLTGPSIHTGIGVTEIYKNQQHSNDHYKNIICNLYDYTRN